MVYTIVKTATVIFRLTKDESTGEVKYPAQQVLVELKSTTIPAKLIGMLSKKLEGHISALAKEGKPQVLSGY